MACSHRGETPLLYTVLPEKTTAVGGAMMGSDHVYEISGVSFANKPYSLLARPSCFISCSLYSRFVYIILIIANATDCVDFLNFMHLNVF